MEIKNDTFLDKKNIAIYGAGIYGKRIFECLKRENIIVEMFIVTENTPADSDIEGIPIYELSKIESTCFKDINVIVAVDERFHTAIKEHIINCLGNNALESFLFFKKGDIDKLYRETHPFDVLKFISSLDPVSRLFGNERGTPIDRYYIENYLKNASKDIDHTDLILEVGEDTYSKRFFPCSRHDVLDYSRGMDLTKQETLPKDKYDVFICTQVFHQIFEIRKALEGAYYLLKKGGVMLATVCGNITKIARNDEYEHYWGFTKKSIELLAKEVFKDNVQVENYGNSAIATAFIQGISLEEINWQLLDKKDEEFTICLSITAQK